MLFQAPGRRAIPVLALIAYFSIALPALADSADLAVHEVASLSRGQVVVDHKEIGDTKYVVAHVLIDAPPDKVWPVMTNPFEFQGKISPRTKDVQVLKDQFDLSLLQMTVHIGFFLPEVTYLVESKYESNERIDFKRVGGVLKDFRGYWEMRPQANGAKTRVTYAMFIDPGFPVPQWIVRQGVGLELPRTLYALRARVMDVFAGNKALLSKTILAAKLPAKAGPASSSPPKS